MIAEDTGAVASRRRDLHGVGREARLTRCKTSTIQVVSEVELLILLSKRWRHRRYLPWSVGGGLILLIVILQFVDPLAAVPVHAVIQLFANSTRRRREADWEVLRPYLRPYFVTVAGYLLADGVPEDGGRAVIGVFALVAVVAGGDNWLAPSPGRGHRFALVGALNGLLQPTIGATGPLLSPASRPRPVTIPPSSPPSPSPRCSIIGEDRRLWSRRPRLVRARRT